MHAALVQIPSDGMKQKEVVGPATRHDRLSNLSIHIQFLYHYTVRASKISLKGGKGVGILDVLHLF